MAEINKMAFFELEDWEMEYIKKAFPDTDLLLYAEKLTEERLEEIKDCDAIAVFIYSRVTKELLDRLPALKLIATMSTGFDHIDLAACQEKGITVCNVPTYGENTVAEHTFALILALSRRIIPSVERTKKGDFDLEGLRGFDLKGKTIGVIGCGNIGRHVIRMAKGFEMEVIVFDVHHDDALAAEMGFRYADMDDLLGDSDIVTLHAPYNEHTRHLINAGNINVMKKGALLINTARGGLVETSALVGAMKSGHLGGAGIDVLEEECSIKEEKELLSDEFSKKCDLKTVLENHMLMNMDNVVLTPHNAFNSEEALMRILDTTIEGIKAFSGGEPINLVGKR